MKKTVFSILAILAFLSVAIAMPAQEEAAEEMAISVKEISPFVYCCIPHTGPFTEIENVIGQLMQAMKSQNVFPAGPMLGVFYNSPEKVKPEELQWEMGFPVTAQAEFQLPLEKKQWDYKAVVSAIHVGPYEATGETFTKMMTWMETEGLTWAGPAMERYLTMPTQETKPEDLKTEIWIPYEKK